MVEIFALMPPHFPKYLGDCKMVLDHHRRWRGAARLVSGFLPRVRRWPGLGTGLIVGWALYMLTPPANHAELAHQESHDHH